MVCAASVVHLILALATSALMGPCSATSMAAQTDGDRQSLVMQQQQRQQRAAASFLRTLEFKHKLRICNAYPFIESVDVYAGPVKLTPESIPYKDCHEIQGSVKAGDKLQFQIGGMSAGSFKVSELPREDAVLVLVIYRHDTVTTAVAFESHVFANLMNAQIAVLDTYRGEKKGSLRVQDVVNASTTRSEELMFDSVVSVNQGIYEVVLYRNDGSVADKQELIALNREAYVVVRCGVEAVEENQRYPQALMVYPHSDMKVLMGGVCNKQSLLLPFFLAAVSIGSSLLDRTAVWRL